MQRQEPAAGTLYLVGTPIGHLETSRGHATLAAVDVIAREDTRYSGQLLSDLEACAAVCHFINTTSGRGCHSDGVAGGTTECCISDAGLPGISDPGEELVAEAHRCGHEVICVPGPCAATTALVSSGLPSDRFCFEGFLPAKGRGRRERVAQIVCETRTTVIYEAPHRLLTLLEELQEHCGAERPVQVARELTKRHEQQVGPNLGAALAHFSEGSSRGMHRCAGRSTGCSGCGTGRVGAATTSSAQDPGRLERQRGSAATRHRNGSAKTSVVQPAASGGLRGRLSSLMERVLLLRLRLVSLSFGAGLLLLVMLCLGAQNGRDRQEIQLGVTRSVPLPSGFLVGVSLVVGVISGGCAGRSDAGSAQRLNGINADIQSDQFAFHHQPGDAASQQVRVVRSNTAVSGT